MMYPSFYLIFINDFLNIAVMGVGQDQEDNQ